MQKRAISDIYRTVLQFNPPTRTVASMPRHPRVPHVLRRGPFTIPQALAAGISPEQLRGQAWRSLTKGWYCWAGLADDADPRLTVVANTLPPGGGLAGLTAARLHGLDLPEPGCVEVVVPPESGVSRRGDARVRCVKLAPGDVIWRGGLPVTSPLRTCFDLAGRLPLVEAVVAIDMALHDGLIELEQFRGYVEARNGIAGVVGARRALDLVEPKAESPMETRLRLLLVQSGLPRPEAQVELHDARGVFVGRPDLFYRDARLGLEYDGENHRDRLVSDNRRQNALQALGVRLLRYTFSDLRERPGAIVNEVREALKRTPKGAFLHTPGVRGAR